MDFYMVNMDGYGPLVYLTLLDILRFLRRVAPQAVGSLRPSGAVCTSGHELSGGSVEEFPPWSHFDTSMVSTQGDEKIEFLAGPNFSHLKSLTCFPYVSL
jgi:hypothetical protein